MSSELDPLAVCRMLAFDAPPAPETVARGVFRLEPGTVLEAVLGSEGEVVRHRVFTWWRPRFAPRRPAGDAPGPLVESLRESVRRELVADVPIGILLSGGIDSTVVAALAAGERPITTLAMGFEESGYDESVPARHTAATLGTRHVELRLTAARAVDALVAVTKHLDEPMADAGCLPTWELFRQAREHVTVAVGGDGGDELLEGYPTYAALDLARRLPPALLPAAKAILQALVALVPVNEDYYPRGYQLRRFLAGLEAEPWYRVQVYVGGCGARILQRVVRPEVLGAAGLRGPSREMAHRLYQPACPEEMRREWEGLDPRDAAVWSHLRAFLAVVLRKVDRMSMAHGLEVRAPMLGSPFAEACLLTAPGDRRRGREGKRPLRRWLAASPLAAASRRPKQGFAIPVARWLRNDFRSLGEEVFLDSSSKLRDWCRPEALAGMWRDHLTGAADARKELWALLALGLWLRYH